MDQIHSIDVGIRNATSIFTFGSQSLTALHMNDNTSLVGTILSSIGKLTQLMELLLWSNPLTDSILATLQNLTQLTFLGLMENQLTGTIPLSFGNLKQLIALCFLENHLTWTIPSTFGSTMYVENTFIRVTYVDSFDAIY